MRQHSAIRLPVLLIIAAALAARFVSPAFGAPPACSGSSVRLSDDYTWFTGSAGYSDPDGNVEFGSTFRWVVNGTTAVQGAVGELMLLNFDGGLAGAAGETPAVSNRVAFSPGAWGSALDLATNGALAYRRVRNLKLSEGTVELWTCLRHDASDSVYTSRWHGLFSYRATNGDWIGIVQDSAWGYIYAGGTVSGQWQSAWGPVGDMRSWRTGEWHCLTFTYSATGNFMRFYVDGLLSGDSNEGHYWAPPGTASNFFIGADAWGTVAHYYIDGFRTLDRAISADEVAGRAGRRHAPAPEEAWLDTTRVATGSTVAFEFIPSDGTETGAPCMSAAVAWIGVPLTNPSPPSTLLAAGSTSLAFSVHSRSNTTCRYAVGLPLPYDQMTDFGGGPTTFHAAAISGIDPDPRRPTRIFVRCTSDTNYLLDLAYRCVPHANPPYPRTGNLWGWDNCRTSPPEVAARIDLWLGADGMTSNEMRRLRELNSNTVVLTSINAVEWHDGLPNDYYLLGTDGARVEVWPGAYRLNVTKTNVAEFLAQHAVDTIVDGGLIFDGCFFDNVFLSQSWLAQDIYGTAFVSDYNEDGLPDDPAAFDAAWKAGVLHELATFRERMPAALTSCHAVDIAEPGITNVFNGISVGFMTADVLEHERSFTDLEAGYNAWCGLAREPHLTMIESSPLDDIAYGYDYSPWEKIPPATLEFAATYHPIIRFGLAFTLMNDGYFAHEYGDTWHGNAWWCDELDFNLGWPLGPAEQDGEPGTNTVENSGFEISFAYPWTFWSDTSSGYTATVTRVSADAPEGTWCLQASITATPGTDDWRIDVAQQTRSLVFDTVYEVVFRARADRLRPVSLAASKGSPDWRNYGLLQNLDIGTNWQEYSIAFTANATTNDARLQFFLGATNGIVWLDDVRLRVGAPPLYHREFDDGIVLLNATWTNQVINVGAGYRRLDGAQAARHEYIVDDADGAFSATGPWNTSTNDSGEWKASGPYYHDWGRSCRISAGTTSVASWTLRIPETDTYTVRAWWPALPASGWTTGALYEVLTDGVVAVSASFSQRTNGDVWNVIGSFAAASGSTAQVRLRALGTSPCVADALYVTSATRYNDGSDVTNVTLGPMDGVILQRQPGWYADRDGDGLPDWWESLYFEGPTNGQPDSDSDTDGQLNSEEWLGGSDPTAYTSYFRISAISADGASTGVVFRWPATSNRVYDVECAAATGDFWRVTNGLAGTPAMNVFTAAPGTLTGMFYRVRARR